MACKCVFYKPEHVMQRGNTMEIVLNVLKCNNEICQRMELKELTKNGVIFLVIMFTLRVAVIKMSQMTHFCIRR